MTAPEYDETTGEKLTDTSRRGFLGAAAAVLTLPATASASETASVADESDTEYNSRPPSTSAAAAVSARADVERDDASVSVRSIRFTSEEEPHEQAEIEVLTFPLSFMFTVDRTAARQLRDALRGGRDGERVGGTMRAFSMNGWNATADVAAAVDGEQLRVEAGGVEATIDADAEARAELAAGLDAALAEGVTVE